jgi:hypothetical protein
LLLARLQTQLKVQQQLELLLLQQLLLLRLRMELRLLSRSLLRESNYHHWQSCCALAFLALGQGVV